MRTTSLAGLRLALTMTLLFAGLVPTAAASPIPPDPQIWVMDNDGTNQQLLAEPASTDDASWSPDSTRLVAGNLQIINATTGETTGLTTGRYPDWSPHDETIVFSDVTNTETTYDEKLYLIQADGSDRRLLTDTALLDTRAAWSPDGQRIGFISGPGSGSPGQVHLVNRDGTGLRAISTATALYLPPEWSPDGQQLAFETFGYRVHLVGADGTNESEIPGFEYSTMPTWCPDGTLYFTGRPTGGTNTGIYRIRAGATAEFVADGAGADCGPTGKLAYSNDGDIHLLDPHQPGSPNLTNSEDSGEHAPLWSPDGTRIAFTSHPNFPDPVVVERSVRLELRKHLVARGRLVASESGCLLRMKLQKMREGGWKTIEKVSPNDDGRFRIRISDRPGFYRVVAPRRVTVWGTLDCARAVSTIVRHRH